MDSVTFADQQIFTAQKMKKPLMENFIFCAVFVNLHRCQKFTGRRAETSENIWTSKDFLTNN